MNCNISDAQIDLFKEADSVANAWRVELAGLRRTRIPLPLEVSRGSKPAPRFVWDEHGRKCLERIAKIEMAQASVKAADLAVDRLASAIFFNIPAPDNWYSVVDSGRSIAKRVLLPVGDNGALFYRLEVKEHTGDIWVLGVFKVELNNKIV